VENGLNQMAHFTKDTKTLKMEWAEWIFQFSCYFPRIESCSGLLMTLIELLKICPSFQYAIITNYYLKHLNLFPLNQHNLHVDVKNMFLTFCNFLVGQKILILLNLLNLLF